MKEMKKLCLGSSLFVDFSAFAKTTAVAETLRSYVTSSGLVQTLNNYVTQTSLGNQLSGYMPNHQDVFDEKIGASLLLENMINDAVRALEENALNPAHPGMDGLASRFWVLEQVAGITKLTVQKVTELPATGTENVIYIVPKSGAGNDVHNEFMWIGGKWELIGSTAVDLTGYATESWVTGQLGTYAKKTDLASYVTNTSLGTTLGSYVQTATLTAALRDYETKTMAEAKYTQVTEVTDAQYAAIANKSDKTWYCIVD